MRAIWPCREQLDNSERVCNIVVDKGLFLPPTESAETGILEI